MPNLKKLKISNTFWYFEFDWALRTSQLKKIKKSKEKNYRYLSLLLLIIVVVVLFCYLVLFLKKSPDNL